MTTTPSFDHADDTFLMERVARDDDRAFEALVLRHQDAMVRFMHRLGANSDAADLAQETFVRLYKGRANYRPLAKFSTYLYTIARRVHIDYQRRCTARPAEWIAFEDLAAIAAKPVPASDLTLDIEEALVRLSERLREVIVLRILEGFNIDEVAAILDIPVGTVKSRLHLGFRELRKHLEAYERNIS